jgi:hypothetical protein
MSKLLSLVQQSHSIDDLEDEMTSPSYGEYRECMASKKASNLNLPTSDWGTEMMLPTGIATSCVGQSNRSGSFQSPEGKIGVDLITPSF